LALILFDLLSCSLLALLKVLIQDVATILIRNKWNGALFFFLSSLPRENMWMCDVTEKENRNEEEEEEEEECKWTKFVMISWLDEKSGTFCVFREQMTKRSYFKEKEWDIEPTKGQNKFDEKSTETIACHQSKNQRDPERESEEKKRENRTINLGTNEEGKEGGNDC
jgi:hypothetical protein